MAMISKMCVSDLKEHELKGQRVLVRFHLDVRLDENLIMIVDSIKVPTVVVNIKYLIAHDAKVILCGHLNDVVLLHAIEDDLGKQLEEFECKEQEVLSDITRIFNASRVAKMKLMDEGV